MTKLLLTAFALLTAVPAFAADISAGSDSCLVDMGDPQFPVGVKGSCCKAAGGRIDDNKEGHPPIRICEGGKYDGYYVGGQTRFACSAVEAACRMVTSHLTASIVIDGSQASTRLNRFWMCNLMFSPTARGAVTSSAVDPATGETKYRIDFAAAVKTAGDDGYDAKSEELTVGRDGTASLQIFSDDGRSLGKIALQCKVRH
jgi:hypothetical protein